MNFCNNEPDIGVEINRAITTEFQVPKVPDHVDLAIPNQAGLGIQDFPVTGGLKYDGGKTMLGLFPPLALEEVSKVLTYGAQKYAKHNWSKGIVYSRLYDASLRHLNSWNNSYESDLDDESGISHLAHAICCLSFLLHFEVIKSKYGVEHELDDRAVSTNF